MASHRNPFPADKDWKKAVASLTVPQPTRDTSTPPLLRWNALPAWQKDNQYILAHYRPASYSYSGSFQSLFYLHNESVNIHVGFSDLFLIPCSNIALLRSTLKRYIQSHRSFRPTRAKTLIAKVSIDPFVWRIPLLVFVILYLPFPRIPCDIVRCHCICFLLRGSCSLPRYECVVSHHIKSFPSSEQVRQSTRLCWHSGVDYRQLCSKRLLWLLL